MGLKDKLVASYVAMASEPGAHASVAQLRANAIDTFEQQGFPTKKMEEWKVKKK